MTDAPELLPCPFCGCKDIAADREIDRRVHCYRCGADGPSIPYAADRKFWTWNTRAEADRQTQKAVAAVLMEAAGKVNEACDGSLSLESRSDEDCAYDDGVREGCAAATHAIRALIPDERADQ